MSRFIILSFLLIGLTFVKAKADQKEIDRLADIFVQKVAPHKESILRWAKTFASKRPMSRADYLSCDVCHPALQLVRPILALGGTEEEIWIAISKVCELFDLAPVDEICSQAIGGYVGPIVYMVQNKPTLTDNDFCGLINKDCGEISPTFTDWETRVEGGKPERTERPHLPAGVGRTKILQFTDVHLDLDYVEGKSTECDYPICCREINEPQDPIYEAGPYGHGRCGLPYKSMQELYERAAADHPTAKYIFLTGDYVHDGIWLYGEEENTRHISNVTGSLRLAFPNTPVIALSGNHETPIVNMYPPPEVSHTFPLEWMYNAIIEPFENNMGDPGQIASFKRGGFYTVVPEDGLRFVVLNTNICYDQNFWLPFDPIDPLGQLQWFSDTMAKAEDANESVYIIAHIPAGSDVCWSHWSNQYNRILSRYAHLVRFQMYGHTHNEFYIVSFDGELEGEVPNSISFTGPSAIADNSGVAYKVYYVDGERGADSTWEVIDHETWIFNSTLANEVGRPEWYREYIASEAFDLASHRPADYYALTHRMVENRDLFEEFRRYYRKNNHEHTLCENAECISEILRDTVNYNSMDRRVSDRIEELVKAAYNPSNAALLLPSLVTSILMTVVLLLC